MAHLASSIYGNVGDALCVSSDVCHILWLPARVTAPGDEVLPRAVCARARRDRDKEKA